MEILTVDNITIALSIGSIIIAGLSWHKSCANYGVEFIQFSPESGYEDQVKHLEEKLKDGKYSILRVDKVSEHGHAYIATLIKIKK